MQTSEVFQMISSLHNYMHVQPRLCCFPFLWDQRFQGKVLFFFFFLIGLSLFTDLQKDIVSCLSYITDLLENTWFQNSFVLQVMGRERFGDT